MVSLVSSLKMTSFSLYSHTLGQDRDLLIQKTAQLGRDILELGMFTAGCWTLCWCNPRLAPLGFLAGFLRRPIQWIMDDFKGSKLTKSKTQIILISASMFLSGLCTFPILIPVAIFTTSAYAGKYARGILFPEEQHKGAEDDSSVSKSK